METIKLNSGWLEKQIKATREEINTWPNWFRASTNTELAESAAVEADVRPQVTPKTPDQPIT